MILSSFLTSAATPTLMAPKSMSSFWSHPCSSCLKTHCFLDSFALIFSILSIFYYTQGDPVIRTCTQNLFGHLCPLPGVFSPCIHCASEGHQPSSCPSQKHGRYSWLLPRKSPLMNPWQSPSDSGTLMCPFPSIFIATALDQSLMHHCSILLFSLTLVMVSLNPCPHCSQNGFPKMDISSCYYSICHGTHRCLPIVIKFNAFDIINLLWPGSAFCGFTFYPSIAPTTPLYNPAAPEFTWPSHVLHSQCVSSLSLPSSLTLTALDQLLFFFKLLSQVSPLREAFSGLHGLDWMPLFYGIHFFLSHPYHGSYHTVS